MRLSVLFGQLARHAELPFRKMLRANRKRLEQAVRGFKEYAGHLARRGGEQVALAASALHR